MKFESYDQMLARQERQNRRDAKIGMAVLVVTFVALIATLSIPLWWPRPKPKLPRATPLITATDITPEEK